MSISTWLQDLSKKQFLWEIYHLNIDLGHIIVNLPKKYKLNYGDKLIQLGMKILEEAITGNEIRATNEAEYQRRTLHLKEARAGLYAMAAEADIFLKICESSPEVEKTKLNKNRKKLGDRLNKCGNLIDAVIASDKKRFMSN